jgi:hypothetical protein
VRLLQARIALSVLVAAQACKSEAEKPFAGTEHSRDVRVSASTEEGGSAGRPGREDCAARKDWTKDFAPRVSVGKIIPADGVEGYCLGDPITPEIVKMASGCEQRGTRRMCRSTPRLAERDYNYDKDGRLASAPLMKCEQERACGYG